MQKQPLPDVQNAADSRNLPINKVGIKSIRHPVRLLDHQGAIQHSIALFDMLVALPAEQKGTHMSRFVDLLNRQSAPISQPVFAELCLQMVERLDASRGSIRMAFPYFINKTAPVSGEHSLLDYNVSYLGQVRDGDTSLTIQVEVPVTSLCPCSKKISQYGAHNQRSHLTLTVQSQQAVAIEELIDIAEAQASSQLYGLLKRPDEKFVTERAYENPKFVEDLVRDVATALAADPRISAYRVESENFESIHNHSAYAVIESGWN